MKRFRTEAGPKGKITFEHFMRLALYDQELGYYRRNRARIGYGRGTDFFTASTTGPLFAELIESAAQNLLSGADCSDITFVEIGAESTGGIMSNHAHGFKAARTIPVGEDIVLNGPCVVFSNELFDAQPFRRFARRGGQWRELGVSSRQDSLCEVEYGPASDADYLPPSAPEGYVIDAPQASGQLLEQIVRQPWHGLFIACDYGKTWPELATACPAGTARAYYRHTQSNDLLARPGEQDLTCHVCWDWLKEILGQNGFARAQIESQEAFFVHQAARFMAETTAHEAGHLSQRKLGLMQLIHPAHLGQKFQVLHATRPRRKDS